MGLSFSKNEHPRHGPADEIPCSGQWGGSYTRRVHLLSTPHLNLSGRGAQEQFGHRRILGFDHEKLPAPAICPLPVSGATLSNPPPMANGCAESLLPSATRAASEWLEGGVPAGASQVAPGPRPRDVKLRPETGKSRPCTMVVVKAQPHKSTAYHTTSPRTFWGDGNVLFLLWGGGYRGIYNRQNTAN